MIKRFCDNCKKEIPSEYVSVPVYIRDAIGQTHSNYQTIESDYCLKCSVEKGFIKSRKMPEDMLFDDLTNPFSTPEEKTAAFIEIGRIDPEELTQEQRDCVMAYMDESEQESENT